MAGGGGEAEMIPVSGCSHTLQAGGIGGGGHSTSGGGGEGGGGDGGGGHSTTGGGGGGEGTGWHGLSHSAHIVHVTWSLETTAATAGVVVVDASDLTATLVAVDVVDGIAKPKIRKVKNKRGRETSLGSSILAAVQGRTDQNPLVMTEEEEGSEFGGFGETRETGGFSRRVAL